MVNLSIFTMSRTSRVKKSTRKQRHGSGIVKTIIDKLQFKVHVPGYNYLKPEMKLAKHI